MSKPIFWNQACEDLSKKDKVMKLIIKKYNKDYLIESKNPFKTLCRSIISQQISTTAAKSIYERFESISSLIPQKIIKISDYKFREIGLNCPKPEGAFYLFPDFENFRDQLNNREIYTSEELCKSLLEEAKVALLPASNFYMPENFLGARVASVDYDGKKVFNEFPINRKISEEICLKIFPNLSKACNNIENWLNK